MKRNVAFLLSIALSVAIAFTQQAQQPASIVPVPDLAPTNAGSYDWMARHEGALKRLKQGKVDLLLIGDSITHGWGGEPVEEAANAAGTELFTKYFGSRNTVNLGFGWDRTQHVLWRFEHGELDGISPKVAVVMIGTNNVGDSAADIALGIETIVKTIRTKLPRTKVLLLGIFPHGEQPTNPRRKLLSDVNALIAPLGKTKNVTYLDLTQTFLEPDGTISKETMRDFLHPTPKGYAMWAEAMEPTLAKLFGDKPKN